MADRTKQIDEGQDKWRQGVDLTSIADVNNYIKFKTLEYEYFRFMNNDLWEQYQEDFADFTEAIFKACNPTTIRNLRTLLRDQGVWVERNKRVTVAQSLYNTIHEENQTEWTKEELLDEYNTTKELFACPKLNVIAGLIPDPLNQIRPTNPSGFRIDLTGQSTPSTQVTDRNTPVNQNTDQITSVVQATNPQAIYPQTVDP